MSVAYNYTTVIVAEI